MCTICKRHFIFVGIPFLLFIWTGLQDILNFCQVSIQVKLGSFVILLGWSTVLRDMFKIDRKTVRNAYQIATNGISCFMCMLDKGFSPVICVTMYHFKLLTMEDCMGIRLYSLANKCSYDIPAAKTCDWIQEFTATRVFSHKCARWGLLYCGLATVETKRNIRGYPSTRLWKLLNSSLFSLWAWCWCDGFRDSLTF